MADSASGRCAGALDHWAKADAPTPINAKLESVFEKNYYKAAIKRQRCLVPATGWYEWTPASGGKQPHLIQPKGRQIFSFAGIWSKYTLDGEEFDGYAILVGPASDEIAGIHNRQPLIVVLEDYDTWLNPDKEDPADLADLLRRQPEQYEHRPVTKRVNSPRNQGGELIEA